MAAIDLRIAGVRAGLATVKRRLPHTGRALTGWKSTIEEVRLLAPHSFRG
jgi:hypothetical protein